MIFEMEGIFNPFFTYNFNAHIKQFDLLTW